MSKEFNITLLPGDGTGPEVVNEAVKVIENTSEQYKIKFNFTNKQTPTKEGNWVETQ